jgi:spermidine/putrescine transport system ATP-binding protein
VLQIELKRVETEVGITFVYVTHDQEEALTMSDRIAVMRGGRVEQLGTPEELYERPLTRFVADFIGTSNLLTGSVESIDGDRALVRLSSGEACVTAAGSDLRVGRSVELSVRPEAVDLRAVNGSGPSSRPGSIPGAVEQVAYLGSNVQYLVRSAGGLSIIAVGSTTGTRIPVGGAVDVSWQPGDALVLADQPALEEVPA